MATHSLYVQAADSDNEATMSVLRFIVRHISVIRQMGVKLRAHKISVADLQDDRLVAALQKRGVTRLPALVTPSQAYLGAQSIIDLYQRNIKEFTASQGPGAGPRGRPAPPPPTDLDSFFHQEMHGSDGNADLQDDDGMGEGSNMMDTYRQMVARREGGAAGPPRPHTPRRNPGEREGPSRAPPKMGGRPDNVRDDHDDIQDTVDQLARNVRGPPRGPPPRGPPPRGPPPRGPPAPPSQSGGTLLDEEDEHNPQDDLMERAYLANMEDSTGGDDE